MTKPQGKPHDELIQRSYQLLALLGVAGQSAHLIAERGDGNTPRDAGNLANTLELASDIAGQIHDVLEKGGIEKEAA